MLKVCFFVLSIFVFTVQALAQVEVFVYVEQTGPLDTDGNVKIQFNKYENATFRISCGYNGYPILNEEERITKEDWSYSIAYVAGIDCYPMSGNSDTATITVSGSKEDAHIIPVTMKVKFTITKYRQSGGIESTREESYSKNGFIAANITPGKLKIELIPQVVFKNRSYTTFGIKETGNINVKSVENDFLRVEINSLTSKNTDLCNINLYGEWCLEHKEGVVILMVKAQSGHQNITYYEEPIALTITMPKAITVVKKSNYLDISTFNVGAGIITSHYLLPKDVSFTNTIFQISPVKAVTTENLNFRKDETYNVYYRDTPNLSDGIKGSLWSAGISDVVTVDRGIGAGKISWNRIKLQYLLPTALQHNRQWQYTPINIGVMLNVEAEFDNDGNCTIIKKGSNNASVTATRGPNDINKYKQNPKNYYDGFQYK
jgi:hypothetical protein